MTRRTGSWLPNLALLCVTLVLTLGAVEIGLRLALPQKIYRFPCGLFVNLPDRVYGLAPGFVGVMRSPETHVRINSLGFRGPEPTPKRPGARRILVLGDSFVSALNVEEKDTFVALLEESLLRESQGTRMDVINAGTPGYGTWHELRALQDLADLVRPDLAVLCVYLGNDLGDNLSPKSSMVQDGFLVNRQKGSGILPYGIRSWLQRNSMTYVLVWNAWDQVRPLFGVRSIDSLAPFKAIVSKRSDEVVDKAYDVSRSILVEAARYAGERRLPLLMVLIPDEMQVYPGPFFEQIRAQGLDPSDYDLDLPGRRWAEIARATGLPVLDLLPVFRAHGQGPHLYMEVEGHLSATGNRVTAEAIKEAVGSLLTQHETRS